MYIVGTSGHIDHGKTSLIKALTGIDCDRLPEEKSREMTIDIGFSRIEYAKFGTVGIVDVPGHERFIRNMVVGAWGIDLAILVIAVDDGWMPQTEDHFRVLDLLGIERIIVALNKIDICDEEMVEIVTEEVEERLQNTRFEGADIIKVSSRTGDGIEELRGKILENLRKLSKVFDKGKPYLFIDRIFGSKGHGTVITGTLKNGNFREDEYVTILPLQKEARIKKIESYYHTLPEGTGSQRTALNLSGITVGQIKRGDIIVRNNFYTKSNDIIARIVLLEKRNIRNNLGVEILIGTSSQKGKLIIIDDANTQENAFPIRIKFDQHWFFYPGEPFILTNPGGYRVIGGGVVVLPAYIGRKYKHNLRNNLSLLKNYSKEEIVEFIIKMNNLVRLNDIIETLPESRSGINKILKRLIEEKAIIQIDDFLVDKHYYEKTLKDIFDAITNNIGLNLKEISDICRIELEFIKIIIDRVLQDNRIIEKDGRYFAGNSITENTLSDEKKSTLSEIHKRGSGGIELEKMENSAHKKRVKELIRLGFLVTLDGNIVYHKEIYEKLKSDIMILFNTRDKVTINDVKETTNLSRKFTIPLLNKIENDGLIKRIGDFRIKA
ncbi:MAG: selenocysteine-specific translation elongation factor [Spirochaetota bacterium]|nr:selenocysteine-specific translation elongation factor [Spirochaetota bacterium]